MVHHPSFAVSQKICLSFAAALFGAFFLLSFSTAEAAGVSTTAGLVLTGQTIKASSTPIAVISLNIATTTETVTGIRVNVAGSAGFATTTDLAALGVATSSGIAVYRDNKAVGTQGQFDAADYVVPLSSAVWGSGTGATTTLTFATAETAPTSDTGGNAGADYFVVIQTAGGATNGHAAQFSVYPGQVLWSATPADATPSALTTSALTVDTAAPTVTGTGPANGTTGVPISTFVSGNFNEMMDFSTLNPSNITFVNHSAGDTPVGAAINAQPMGFFLVVSNPPVFATSSRFAKVASTAFNFFQIANGSPIAPQGGTYTSPVAGDIVYFQHDTFPAELGVVTNATLTGGTFAVNNFNLFGSQSISKFATPTATGLVTAATALKVGDLVVTNTATNPATNKYAWHIVTTAAAMNSTSLRLDGAPGWPIFMATSTTAFSTIAPAASTTVNSSNQFAASTTLAIGDMVFANVTAGADNLGGYAWHLVTAAESVATSSAPSALRLDGAGAAPAFAANSVLARIASGAQGAATDTATSFSFGDMILASAAANAANTGSYSFHIVSRGNDGTGGITSPNLRLDNSSGNLLISTNYVMTIGTGVKDTAGNALAAPVTVSFTTGTTGGTNVTPPFIQSSQPQMGSQTFAPNAPVQLTFSVDMAGSGAGSVYNTSNIGIYADNFGALGTQVTAVNGYASSTRTVSITPSPALSTNTNYIARVANTVRSANDIALPQEYRLNFKTASTTDTIPPTVLGVYPTSGAPSVPRNSIITAGFSEDLDPSTVTASNVTLSGGISGSVSYNPQSRSVSFAPTTQLAASTLYTFTVGTGVKDLAGNALASSYTSTFTAGSATDSTLPSIAFSNADNFGVAVTFSEPMKQGGGPTAADNIGNYTLESPVGSSIALGGKTVTYDGGTKTARISGLSLQNGNTFKVTVSSVAQDLAGNGMDTTGSPAKNTSFGTVANSATTGGQLGPGSGPTMDPSMQGMNPTRVTPMTRMAGVVSNYQLQFLAATSIPLGGKIVLTFPNGFDVTNATTTPAGTQSFCNSDINGPMAGAVTIDPTNMVNDPVAGTITMTTAGSDTGANAFICVDLAGIVNSTIPSTSGYTVDIKTRNTSAANLALLETKTSSPFFLGATGSNTLTVHLFHDDVAVNGSKDSGEEIAGAKVYLFSPAAGGEATTTTAAGVATFNNLANGDYQIGVQPSGLSGYTLNFAPQPITIAGNVTKKIIASTTPRTIAGTIYGPASTVLDVFASSQSGFAKTTVTTNSTPVVVGGVTYGGSVAYGIGAQNNTTYQLGVGPSIPETSMIPGSPPPPMPTFNFMPPAPVTVAVATVNITGTNFTLTTAGNTIAGTVKDSTGAAVSNAGVFCRPVATSSTSGASSGFGTGGMTGTNGAFAVKVVPGAYLCGVAKPGMPMAPDKQVTSATGGVQMPASLDFTLGVSTSNVTITGTIKDDSGNAIPYAGVSARKVTSSSDMTLIGGGSQNFVGGPADANGAYTLYVSAGTWVVEAFAPGVGRLGTKTITVGTSNVTGQDFSAQTLNLGSITGTATQGGTNVQGVMVRADNASGSSGNMTTTANDGTYTLKLPAGVYTLKCFFPGVGESTPTTGITVAASTATTGKNCTIDPPITITVNVTDGTNPITNAFVDVRNSSGLGNSTNLMSTTTGANAVYKVSVQPGTYSVRVGHPAYGLIGTKTATTTQSLTFTTSAGTLFAVTGTVTAGGVALPNAWVSVSGTPTGQSNVINIGGQTDANGAFSINVPAGSYKVRAFKPGYTGGSDVTATVTAATAVGAIPLTAASRTISGSITLNGSPVSGAYVDANDGVNGFAVAQTDSSGAFSLPVGNGSWTLNGHSQGYVGSAGVVVNGSNVTQNLTLDAISGFTVKPQKQENVTPTAGGLLTNTDIGPGFKLNIPANALGTSANAGTVNTQINTAVPTPLTGVVLSKNAVSISASDSTGQPIKNLNDSVTVVIPYTVGDIPTGQSESNLAIGVWNDATQSYDTLPTTIDTTAHTLSASVSHFSDFAPILPAASQAAATPAAASAASSGGGGPVGLLGTVNTNASVAVTTVAPTPASPAQQAVPHPSPVAQTRASPMAVFNRTLAVGVKGDDVAALQSFLENHGFLSMPKGVAKGLFGASTKKALMVYQKSIGLPAIGVFGPATRTRIESENTSAQPEQATTPSPTATPAAAGAFSHALSAGSKGADVAALQAFLASRGFMKMPSGGNKGIFGGITKKALIKYQQSVGLEGTGSLGPKTRTSINAQLRAGGSQ